MAAGDWIKVHRCILDSEVFADPWLLKLWLWCLCRANFGDQSFKGQTIKRGSFVTGRIRAAEELDVSPSTFYRGIKRLEGMGCISINANSVWTTVTVCNYETYQNVEPAARTASDTTNGQPMIQPTDTIEEDQELKNSRSIFDQERFDRIDIDLWKRKTEEALTAIGQTNGDDTRLVSQLVLIAERVPDFYDTFRDALAGPKMVTPRPLHPVAYVRKIIENKIGKPQLAALLKRCPPRKSCP